MSTDDGSGMGKGCYIMRVYQGSTTEANKMASRRPNEG